MNALRCFAPVIVIIALAGLAACGGPDPQGAYYRPSPGQFVFDYDDDTQTFAGYIAASRAYLDRNRIYFGGEPRETELDRIAPYEMTPSAACIAAGNPNTRKGVLLIHGALGTAYALKDIAIALNEKCFHVRGLLLAGHGTRMGDTLIVDNADWIDAVDFGIRGYKNDPAIDGVYLVGFSLGGLLAAHAATRHPDLDGIIMYSPALVLESSDFIGWQTTWARYFRPYLYVQGNTSPVRYQSMSMNLAAQIVGLRIRTAAAMRRHGGIKPPVYAQLTHDDISIDPVGSLGFLEKHAENPASRFIYYTRDDILRDDPRTEIRDSHFPAQRVVDFSHVTFVYAPDNDLFGRGGRLKECGQTIGHATAQQMRACFASDNNWHGELPHNRRPGYAPLQRLTFHPQFDSMIEEVISFMN